MILSSGFHMTQINAPAGPATKLTPKISRAKDIQSFVVIATFLELKFSATAQTIAAAEPTCRSYQKKSRIPEAIDFIGARDKKAGVPNT